MIDELIKRWKGNLIEMSAQELLQLVDLLIKDRRDYLDAYEAAMSDTMHGDEKHCTCFPFLRKELEEKHKQISQLRRELVEKEKRILDLEDVVNRLREGCEHYRKRLEKTDEE